MKKVFLHKMPSLKSTEGASGHSNLTNTLKAIVSGELRLDRGLAGGMESSMSHTSIIRKQSTQTKATKGLLNDSNSSSGARNEESLQLNRKIDKEDFSNDRQSGCRIRSPEREDFPKVIIDEVLQLRKEVAEIRDQMYQTPTTDNRTNNFQSKTPGSCSSIQESWTELYLAGSTSEIRTPVKPPPKPTLQKRVQILEDIMLSGKDRLHREQSAKLLQAESEHHNTLKNMTERLFRVESHHSSIRSDLQTFKVFFPLTKAHLVDQLDREVCSLTTRVELLESAERRPENRKQQQNAHSACQSQKIEQSPFCRKQSQDARREIADVKAEFKAFNSMLATINEQIQRYSNVESELKELLARQEGKIKLEVKDLADKIVEIEEYVCQHSEYIEALDIRAVKIYNRCEQTASRIPPIEAKLQQQSAPTQQQITAEQFTEALQSLQSQQDGKLIRIIQDYNENFLTIDHTICDIKDFIQQVLILNKTITQKLQSIWRHHVTGREQLEEICKTSGDVYLLLENNIQKICELSKKEMSFEHEVKELKEKMEVVDTLGSRCRRVGSLNGSFSDCKSSIGEIKENMLPTKSRIFNRSIFTSLLDENIQDQCGEFDRLD